jgi:hypothetical protein
VSRRTLPVAITLTAAAGVLLTACGGGTSKTPDKIAGASSGSPTQASSSPSAGAPKFDLPPDVQVVINDPKTGDSTKDKALQDLEYSIKARLEGYIKGDGETANMLRYFTTPAGPYWAQDISNVRKQGLTLTGRYSYYDFSLKLFNDKSASAEYCEDQRQAFGKVIKTGQVQRTQPSMQDFRQYVVAMKLDDKGDWQVAQVHWQKGVTSCKVN